LVPKTPSFTARVSSASSAGIGFIRLTPPFSASRRLFQQNQGEADMNRRERRAGSVENDPKWPCRREMLSDCDFRHRHLATNNSEKS
jgi:hypothetical protein